jgi:hypothetical protein
MPSLRIGADREHELKLRQPIEQGFMPKLGAFGSGRQIATIFILPGKAKAHGDDGDARLVVKLLRTDPHPIAQAVAGSIGEGNA